MTKAELLEMIAEIPEDAEVLAYHITTKAGERQDTRGGITTSGNRAMAHACSVLKHVAGCLEVEVEDLCRMMLMYQRRRDRRGKATKENSETVEIRSDLLEKMLGGGKNDQ